MIGPPSLTGVWAASYRVGEDEAIHSIASGRFHQRWSNPAPTKGSTTRFRGDVIMKRICAPLTLVLTMLLLISLCVAPVSAKEISGTISGTVLDHPVPPPDDDDDDGIPIVTEGDPDELTGGNLSVTDPRKPGTPDSPDLWQRFLDWIQQSTLKFQSSR